MNNVMRWLCTILLSISWPVLPADGAPTDRNVILVTLDGVRIQEVFGGLNEAIASHDAQKTYSEIETARERYGGASPEQRRARLMPHFWSELAPQGMVFGNPAHGNHVRVQNRVMWSSPGYAELLTGAPRPDIVDNSAQRHPYPTALEHARKALGLGFHQVAQFGTWDGYSLAAAGEDGAFLMVGAHDAVPAPWSTPELDLLADVRAEVMGLWEEGTDQVLTYRMAREFLQRHQPRVMWLALGNSDDWAHADRYDRYLECLHQQDALLADLWATLQSLDAYRDRTSLIVTTDHGRGRRASDWSEHDVNIPGSEDIWLAVIGPDTPDVGEVRDAGTIHAGQVASTLIALLGLDPADWGEDALGPVAEAVSAKPSATTASPPLPDPLEAGWRGERVCERLHEDGTHRVLRCAFPPGSGHERHFHRAHFGYAIAGGRMEITDASGTRAADLADGSHFSSDGVDWHEVRNVGDTTVIYLIVEPR